MNLLLCAALIAASVQGRTTTVPGSAPTGTAGVAMVSTATAVVAPTSVAVMMSQTVQAKGTTTQAEAGQATKAQASWTTEYKTVHSAATGPATSAIPDNKVNKAETSSTVVRHRQSPAKTTAQASAAQATKASAQVSGAQATVAPTKASAAAQTSASVPTSALPTGSAQNSSDELAQLRAKSAEMEKLLREQSRLLHEIADAVMFPQASGEGSPNFSYYSSSEFTPESFYSTDESTTDRPFRHPKVLHGRA